MAAHGAGPVVVVTGASAGVGRAVVRRFAQFDRARIALLARGRQRLDAAAGEVRVLGGEALALPCDVADAHAVDEAADRAEREFGPIDIWVNCAMATVLAPFAQVTPDEFRRVTEVTYLGYVHGTMSALKRMRARDRGTIVQVGSALAYRSIPLQSAYCGAKHAIVGFTDSIRSELIHDGSQVEICAAHLPAVNTPQFEWARNRLPNRPRPLAPIFQPEVAAEGIHFLAHNPRRELWIGRSAILTILGQKVAPGVMDRVLAAQAWSGQQTDEPDTARADNLFEPAPGDYAAHGRFDERATYSAPALKAAEHMRTTTAMLALGLAVLVAGLALAGRARSA
jgi:NAD(P)-dependent dehydrogenase (short-subunit alcohol dehydrogenase family)